MADGESLESWLNKATSPSNRQEDWEFIMGFCDQINKELEGPQISVRLLAHKVQSPQEWEAMQALTVLEACMKNCGQRFHNEVGKFRFLNELIKVVSPKYLGDKVSEKVKSKVIELLYSWTVSLPDEAKVLEAYAMLKSQGIVVVDPEIPLDATLIPSPSPRPKNPVFDDDKKSKRLAELLKSKKPEDLQEANRLIKNMVKEDEARAQKEKKLKSTLEAVNSSVRLLNEMLEHFSPEDSTDGDKELIRELHSDCEKLRQTVCQLATEAEDNDSSLGEILQANDDLALVIDSYKKVVAGHISNGGQAEQSEILIDLEGLDFQVVSPPSSSHLVPAESQSLSPGSPSAAVSLLDEELLSLGLNDPAPIPSKSSHLNLSNHLASSQDSSRDFDFFHSTSPSVSSFSTSWLFPDLSVAGVPVNATRSSPGSVSSTPPVSVSSSASFPQTSSSDLMISAQPLSTSAALSPNLQDLVLLDLDSPKPTEDLLTPSSPGVTSTSTSLVCGEIQTDSPESRPLTQDVSLTNVFVPLDAIKPSKVCPVTAYDNNGVQVLLHFASECPAGRPDVLVMVVSMLNTAPLPVRNVALQAAVPKTMKVRLQAPTGTELAPFNPILPPAAITQVMLLSNPLKEKVRMRYKLTFTLGERLHSEVGEVSEFPPADCWGAL